MSGLTALKIKSARFLSLAFACFLLISTSEPALSQLAWSEEFNEGTAPDSANWSYDLGSGGWGNSELQTYTNDPSNVRVEGGHLVISVLGDNGAGFSSARIRTQDKLTFKYGTIEARIRIPDLEDGLWPAFWTMGNDFSQVGWPASGEIDIMEMGSADAIANGLVNRQVGSAAHWEQHGDHVFHWRTVNAPMDLDDGFHLYRMDWTPGSVSTFIDDLPVWTMDISSPACNDCDEFHQPHFMILNVAVGGTYPQRFSPVQISAPLPAEMLVDYIRVYDNGFTELGGSSVVDVPLEIGPGHSGSWIPETPSAHGFSMEFGRLPDDSAFAVVYWYIYDSLGNPIFLVGTGTPDGNTLEVRFESPVGLKFGEFDLQSLSREDGGTGYFEFSDEDRAIFSYTPSEFSEATWGHTPLDSMPILKLFGIPVDTPGQDSTQ